MTGEEYDEQDELNIYPTNLFVTTQERINTAIGQIDVDLGTQVNFLKEIGKPFEAKRLYERVTSVSYTHLDVYKRQERVRRANVGDLRYLFGVRLSVACRPIRELIASASGYPVASGGCVRLVLLAVRGRAGE